VTSTAQIIREELLESADATRSLPMLSGMMNEVFRIIADPDSSFGQLHDVVKYDQAISSRIISIANSVHYSRGTQVTSLERAMVMVGFKEIERIIMCLVFMKQIMAPWKLAQEDLAVVWEHSLNVAHASRTLAIRTGVEDPEKTFAVSILHDIGKLIFYMYGDRYAELTGKARDGALDICDLERAEYGVDHQEVGHRMSIKWEFPKEFSDVILRHHDPSDRQVAIIDIVRHADAFMSGREDVLPERERTVLQLERIAIEAETARIRQLVVA
jgi:putative nucleotidyltransferase with HDIG domain